MDVAVEGAVSAVDAPCIRAFQPKPFPSNVTAGRARQRRIAGGVGGVVQNLVPEFERRAPGIRVRVQQIPWSAAHEKLLTAYVGNAMPDVVQVGNTWIPEFVALGALAPLDAWLAHSTTARSED